MSHRTPTKMLARFLLPSLLALALLSEPRAAAADTIPDEYGRADARRYVLDDFCRLDSVGYLETHSSFYRRTYARALAGNSHALRMVLLDRRFHSGDNESWEPVSGNLLYVVGDARFDRVLSTMSDSDQRFVMTYVYNAGFFHDAYLQGDKKFSARNFPITHHRYTRFYPHADD